MWSARRQGGHHAPFSLRAFTAPSLASCFAIRACRTAHKFLLASCPESQSVRATTKSTMESGISFARATPSRLKAFSFWKEAFPRWTAKPATLWVAHEAANR